MRRIMLTVAYDGTEYAGFQRQPGEVRTVEGELDAAVSSVTGENIEKAVHRLRRPMDIDGVTVQAKGVDIVQGFPDRALLSITIGEGRNRQVRKMCEQAGLKVTRLVRVEEGGVELGNLKTGCWRKLTKTEITKLM